MIFLPLSLALAQVIHLSTPIPQLHREGGPGVFRREERSKWVLRELSRRLRALYLLLQLIQVGSRQSIWRWCRSTTCAQHQKDGTRD